VLAEPALGAGGQAMRTIAIVNQKGGCGKTTTAVNLAGCLAAAGDRVLLVDLDPQAHATLAFGVDPEALAENLYEILVEPIGTKAASRVADVIRPWSDQLHIAPSGIVLSALEQKLTADRAEQRTERLAAALAAVADRYAWCLIDCPPNVGVLTFNALRAAREVIVPLETSEFAMHGVEKLLETVALLTERVGHALAVRILPTLYDGRTRYARETLNRIRERFGDLCFDTVIRANVKLREAVTRGEPIVAFARSANGAQDYGALAIELSLTPPPDHFVQVPAAGAGEREVVVRYRDPDASDVRIAGDFNGWVPDKNVRSLVQAEGIERVWTKILRLPPGTYHYRYVVDGEWREDPANPDRVPSLLGPPHSRLVVR
jgi:chromosome partitioning protein